MRSDSTDHVPYRRILELALDGPWAILPEKLELISEVLADRVAGIRYDELEREARLAGVERQAALAGATSVIVQGNVAVIPVYGMLIPRASLFAEMSGATSAESISNKLRAALADPNVRRIVLDIDSPGGLVGGIPEAGTAIRAAAAEKPVIAVANHLAASAAYWLGSQATELMVTPSAEVGSIGVIQAHKNLSRALDAAGVDMTVMRSARFKGEGNAFEPLSEDAREYFQARLNEVHAQFVDAVAVGRGVSPSAVRTGFGEGRVFGAEEAVRRGMADRIGTFAEAMDRAANPRIRLGRKAAEDFEGWERDLAAELPPQVQAPALPADYADQVTAALREQLQEVQG